MVSIKSRLPFELLETCRNICHGWSTESVQKPSQIFCIIHNKMGTTKIALPQMERITMTTAHMYQIPISCIGMLMQSHDDGTYVQYSTSLWPRDSNLTIFSLRCILHTLERPPVCESKDLFSTPPQKNFFEALLHAKSGCNSSDYHNRLYSRLPWVEASSLFTNEVLLTIG